jgi:prepilin-type N-terminal cleavage/methylation domain-containing protein
MKKGFTIIEIIVVIGIIAVLTVIIFPSLNNIRKKNRDTERVSDIATIQLGLSMYYNQHQGSYPSSLEDSEFVPKYLTNETLHDPDGSLYTYVPLKRSGDKCTYYHLGAKLEMSSAQIDRADNFSSVDGDISNNYSYCGGYSEGGINGVYDAETNPLMYDVRP